MVHPTMTVCRHIRGVHDNQRDDGVAVAKNDVMVPFF
jgi:hypothetical protein